MARAEPRTGRLAELRREMIRCSDTTEAQMLGWLGEYDTLLLAEQTRRLTVYVVTRHGEVVAVHGAQAEAEEDREIRTGRGMRPDLERRYAVEAWAVQDSRNLKPDECPYCKDPAHFRRVEIEGGGHVHQQIAR